MKFAYAGTPALSARVLTELAALGHTPCMVISQPDRPSGRGRGLKSPPVVLAARELGLPCHQPESINSPDIVQAVMASGAEVLVVVAFGQLLKPPLLDSFLCLNLHASLLPAHRGAAPIARAIIAGDEETGICIMRITQGLDEGPVGLTSRVSINLRDDAGSLETKLVALGALGLAQVMTGLQDGNVKWVEQAGEPSYAPKLTAADRRLEFRLDARQVHDRVRALSPGVGCDVTTGDGLRLKLWRTWPYGLPGHDDLPPEAADLSGQAGILLRVGERLFAGCGEGAVELLLLQPAGKKQMRVTEFLRGYGPRLGAGMVRTGHTTPVEGHGPRREEQNHGDL